MPKRWNSNRPNQFSSASISLTSLLIPALILVLGATACRGEKAPSYEVLAGVPLELAQHRAATVRDLRYEVFLSIPARREESIAGVMTARFQYHATDRPLQFDFNQPSGSVRAVAANGQPADFELRQEHVVIPAQFLVEGENEITLQFTAGDGSLNRTEELLYTLFVPDRARVALPIFDQPDLKGKFKLRLETPEDWEAVANGPVESRVTEKGRTLWSFGETPPLSTYLFSFAAGRFQVETSEVEGRVIRMYHRETDSEKISRNRDAIFDLHRTALKWLEEYTEIRYPFQRFDLVLIPAFQYRGMEHPGAILYRADRLFLDESATQNEYLARASVIAHETAHMWFGDLVTMRWFNDVWMKEVFANFMAAKIVHPTFPDLDHELRFLLAHYPGAYAVDRTEGANPVRQKLENLNKAGSVYGAIIYQKAPIVMKHLERLIGEDSMRAGLREYLGSHSFGNATWPDLIAVLDASTSEDLESWSRAWVMEPRRPRIQAALFREGENIGRLVLAQEDPVAGRELLWNQRLEVLLGYPDGSTRVLSVQLTDQQMEVPGAVGLPAPVFILVNGRGVGYGLFLLDEASREYLLEHLPGLTEPLARAVAWMSLWDEMFEGEVEPSKMIALALAALDTETDQLNVERILTDLVTAFWKFLPVAERESVAAEVEAHLWERLQAAGPPGLKGAYLHACRSTAFTPEAVNRLRRVWSGEEKIDGLTLSENDTTQLAWALAVREVPDAEEILEEQRQKIQNPDRRARFEFVRPSLSADEGVRDHFFESLKDPRQREKEPWVLAALENLHHPLRAAHSEKYVGPSLELLEEIQQTGDIFFPKDWLDRTLSGHRSAEIAQTVRLFLQERSDFPADLRAKLLQSADSLFRAVEISKPAE